MQQELADKVLAVARDFVIYKPLTRWNDQYKNFPRFVMEYLVTQYVDPADPLPGQKRIDRLLTEHYSDSSERELVRSRIKESGEYKLIGDLRIRLDAKRDTYWADIPAIGENTVRIANAVRSRYEAMLLTVGAWGQITIEYDSSAEVDKGRHPFGVTDFVPFQITRIDLDDFIRLRESFSFDEWLDILVESIGFDADSLSREVKLLMVLRLVPFVEPNYNLIELGPRETGKTYTYRNTSGRGFVISGSKTTAASLFWAASTNKIGILGQKDVVFFDEIAHAEFDSGGNTVTVLKDYMQSGTFSRLGKEFQSDASIVLGGNIDTDLATGRPSLRYIHYFEPLPTALQDAAFLDRLHAYLPGWRMPKIVPTAYSTGYGFVTDYLAEVFHLMRRVTMGTLVEELAELDTGSDRNQTAIKKTVSGLLKLLYPGALERPPDAEGFKTVLDLASSARRLVVEQLAAILPGEYDPSVIRAKARSTDSVGATIGGAAPGGDRAVRDIRDVIGRGENAGVELKETFDVDIATGESSPKVLNAALKTVAAFLNSNRGTLLIGVADSGAVRGLDRDYAFCKAGRQDRDGFEQKLRDVIKSRFTPQPFGLVDISFVALPEGEVCRVDVRPSETPVFLDNKIFVRDGNRTLAIEDGPKASEWLAQRLSR